MSRSPRCGALIIAELLVVQTAAQLEVKFEAFDFGLQKGFKPFEARHDRGGFQQRLFERSGGAQGIDCLLYTSDAADE